MPKRHSPRTARIGDEIQRELMTLLREEVKDPRVGRVTVTHVEVTPDLSHAKVLVTDLAGREHAAETVAALGRAAGFLRSELRPPFVDLFGPRSSRSSTTTRSNRASRCRD